MKNLHAKLKNHGKKVIIHLKRHHRKYLFGALCSGILALVGLHTASTINSTFADEEPVNPSITYDSNANITYIDTEGREFTGIGTITISNGEDSITMLDRNLGATEKGTGENSYGYYFQYGNNFGFSHNSLNNTGEQKVNISPVGGESYEWNNPYVSDIFIMGSGNGNRTYSRKTNIWGGSGDSESTNYYQTVENAYERQGPCPAGYHIPSAGEWAKLIKMFHDLDGNGRLYDDDYYGHYLYYIYNKDYHDNFLNSFYIPYNGNIDYYQGKLFYTGTESILWSSSTHRKNEADDSVIFYARSDDYTRQYGIRSDESSQRANGISIRCFKDSIGSSITLSFNTNGGTKIQSQTLSVGSNGYLPGYTTNKPDDELIGWFLDRDFSQPFSFDIPLYEGTLIYAKWLNNNWIDDVIPVCIVEYDITGPTNQDVVAYLTGCSEEISAEETEYTFTGNGTYTFEFEDLAGNSGEATATVDRIDKVATCDVEYSTTGQTNQDVLAYLTGCSEEITTEATEYTFTENGTHTFEFQDLVGNNGSTNAEVTWIDIIKPTCDVTYSTTGTTTGNVTATLTGCSEAITGTDLQHTFTGNGTYTFNFQDLAGNTGSTEAAVTWIGEYTGVYEIKSGQQMINLYNQGKAITCNVIYSGDNGHQTNTMYIKSGVINENLMIITGNTRTMLYSLEKDGYIYSWGDMYLDGIGFYIPYELDVYEELKGVDNNIKSGAIITCTTGVEEDSVFDLPDGVDFFNIDTYYIDSGVYFIIDAKETAKTGENIDFTITVMKDGKKFKNFLGYVLIDVIDEYGDLLDKNTYEAPGYGYYYFASSDNGKKTFSNGLKINKTGDYYIRVNSLQEGEGFFPISIKGKNDPTLTGNYFKITVNSKAKPGEYTTFTVRAMKDGISYSNYTGTVIFTLSKKDGSLVNKRNYTFSNSGRYTFEASDLGRKIFYSGLKINETGTYILEVNGLNDNFKGSTTINVGKSHGSAEFKYDTLKFNPKYSDEMNEAYQYARYYDITTKDSIKDADMYSGLNRIAMAKMLTNYAENVLGEDNFDTRRNCTFTDVSNSLDKDYDYGVTKACQLGIMGVNMPNNKFYPNGGVTRAEFATALSRLLYNTKDGTERYYSTHITKLRREGIITNTDPALWELRGYVMLMLKRVAEK